MKSFALSAWTCRPWTCLLCLGLLLADGVHAEDAQPATAAAEATLGIGDLAPPIDVGDWIHPGSHRPVKPFTAFQPGTIYVLEFWATWCEYSREAIPVLAALQKAHDRAVVVLAIGVDAPQSIRAFLADADPDVRELAAEAGTYCLAADPDGSVHDDYMGAIRENGLPTAFVIGRQGLVEWIGHPLDAAEPLGRIVDGSWDRGAFAGKWVRLQDARRLVDEVVALVAAGRVDAAVSAVDRFAAAHATDALVLNEVAWMLVERAGNGPVPEALLLAAERAAVRSVTIEPDDGNMLDTLAHLQALLGRVDQAIATQRRAVDRGGKDATRFLDYLRSLESRKQ